MKIFVDGTSQLIEGHSWYQVWFENQSRIIVQAKTEEEAKVEAIKAVTQILTVRGVQDRKLVVAGVFKLTPKGF